MNRRVILVVLSLCFVPSPLFAQSQVGRSSDESTNLTRAVQSSLRFLTIEHLYRIAFQEKTRAELGGPFFQDYRRSVRVPRQWGDGDSRFTNYYLHPVQGAVSAYIWLDSHPEAITPFGNNRPYWESRFRAIAWAAGYSLQFEIGPLSEASIGNVGLNSDTVGWVDHVMTPTGGLMMMIGEDALDRFLLRKLEARTQSPVVRAILRIALTPSRSTANVSGMRYPWYRADRPIRPEEARFR